MLLHININVRLQPLMATRNSTCVHVIIIYIIIYCDFCKCLYIWHEPNKIHSFIHFAVYSDSRDLHPHPTPPPLPTQTLHPTLLNAVQTCTMLSVKSNIYL